LKFAQHLPIHDTDWVSLQVGGDVAGELNLLRTHLKNVAATGRPTTDEDDRLPHIQDAGSRLEDFLDTARAITTTDQVITVDTAVAHLAGALGHPTTLLLPSPPDWRWGLNQRAISNWWYFNTQTRSF
jgi:ADP-heptose:LPS heptosyltransferase